MAILTRGKLQPRIYIVRTGLKGTQKKQWLNSISDTNIERFTITSEEHIYEIQ